jgi:hypothetical protein
VLSRNGELLNVRRSNKGCQQLKLVLGHDGDWPLLYIESTLLSRPSNGLMIQRVCGSRSGLTVSVRLRGI